MRHPFVSFLLVACWTAGVACAQQRADVPYVPTPVAVVDAMLDAAQVTANDYLIDLGSGDGRIVLTAAGKRGARATGVELDPALVADAKREADRLGIGTKANFTVANIYVFDFSAATVLTMYLLPHINVDLRPRILNGLRPGTRVVSHDFDMGKWRPDVRREVPVPNKPYGPPVSQVYLWYVPANVAGQWQWRIGELRVEATVRQTFQQVTATAASAGAAVTIQSAQLQGDALRFALAIEEGGRRQTYEFSGRVSGDKITGSMKTGEGRASEWLATRSVRGEMNIE